jgi:hypothetical protein
VEVDAAVALERSLDQGIHPGARCRLLQWALAPAAYDHPRAQRGELQGAGPAETGAAAADDRRRVRRSDGMP